MRESQIEKENPQGEECSMCGKRKLSVHTRPDSYQNDVNNNPDAVHTVCDDCDYQNLMSI